MANRHNITFNTEAEYNTFKASSGYVTPNVSYIIESDNTHYNPYDYSDRYLTFVAKESGTFKFSGNSISYSLDSGSTWTSLASDTNSPTVSAGSKIMWKATLTPTSSGIGKFSSSGNFTVEGNAMSLLYGDDFDGKKDLTGKDYAFYELFKDCATIINADKLTLLATTLADCCYMNMFYGCTGITTVPNNLLPATTVVYGCYDNMFRDCRSLISIPSLPATNVAISCYRAMFRGCTSITTVPNDLLQATDLTDGQGCYAYMFNGCTSLTTAPELPATVLVPSDENVTNGVYVYMFAGCTSLTTAPELPATTLVKDCYKGMFSGCTSLSEITCFATDISATDCTTNWVDGVAASGTFTKAASMTGWTSGNNGIPNGWTVENCYDYNGHDYVDLGLPSGTKWATMNVGASSITGYGNYYQYGKGAAQYFATSGNSDYSGTENPLAASADTAAQVWGGDWHMPTEAQFTELTANTTYEWTTIDGINGSKFTAQNGNYVFFPAAGKYNNGSYQFVGSYGSYYSSTPDGMKLAYCFDLHDNSRRTFITNRYYGFSMRPVVG